MIHRTASRWRELEGDAVRLFGFTRDPWDRAVSLFAFFNRSRPTNVVPAEFRAWVVQGCPHPSKRRPILYPGTSDAIDVRAPQLRWLAGVEWIGRFERIGEDFARLLEWLELPPVDLPRENAARHPPPLQLYDDRTVDLIGERYREDVEWLGAEPPKLRP